MIAKKTPEQNKSEESLNLWQVAGSVLAAFFGVQSSKNYQRDFNKGKPIHYVVMGIFLAAVFVGCIITVVQIVLP